MAEITVELIKTLRDKLGAGMMDCKAALVETGGDLEAAEALLRKKGVAAADKKAGRAANEGVVAVRILEEGRTGILVEVSCETDFVARNEKFREIVEAILDHIATGPAVETIEELHQQPFSSDPSRTLETYIKEKVGQLGENMGLARFVNYNVGSAGIIGSYIHPGDRIGVMVELAYTKPETAANPNVAVFLKDLSMHIAASQPLCISRDQVPADKVEAEKDIYRDQIKGKPENIAEKILEGKLGKFYSTCCLLEQPFVKDDSMTIQNLLDDLSKATGDEIRIVRFHRYGVGELASA